MHFIDFIHQFYGYLFINALLIVHNVQILRCFKVKVSYFNTGVNFQSSLDFSTFWGWSQNTKLSSLDRLDRNPLDFFLPRSLSIEPRSKFFIFLYVLDKNRGSIGRTERVLKHNSYLFVRVPQQSIYHRTFFL